MSEPLFIFLTLLQFVRFRVTINRYFRGYRSINFFFLYRSRISRFLLIRNNEVLNEEGFVARVPRIVRVCGLLRYLGVTVVAVQDHRFSVSRHKCARLTVFTFNVRGNSRSRVGQVHDWRGVFYHCLVIEVVQRLQGTRVVVDVVNGRHTVHAFIAIRSVAFNALPLVFRRFLTSHFLFNRLVVSFFVHVVLKYGKVSLPKYLVDNRYIHGVNGREVNVFYLSVCLRCPIVVQDPLRFLHRRLFIPVSRFREVRRQGTYLVLRKKEAAIPRRASRVIFIVVIVVRFKRGNHVTR